MFSAFYNQVPFVFPNPDLLSVFSSAARHRPRPALSAALQLCAPLHLAPRVALSLLPPPALPALVAHRSSMSGRRPKWPPRRPVRHAGAARRSAPGHVISLSHFLLSYHRALLQNVIEPLLPGCFAFSFSPRHRAAAAPPRWDPPQPRHPAQFALSLPHLLP
jgi:hypothetical protein